jgi:hypothetical protein
MAENTIATLLALNVEEGQDGPVDILDDEIRNRIQESPTSAQPSEAPAATKAARYVPSDPARPWRDFQVQAGARRFLKEVVLPDWITNHPHKPCSNIRVDEWGRVLCRYITPTQIGVDGPWENPTHFLMYAYNTVQAQQKYGMGLNAFLRDFCNITL